MRKKQIMIAICLSGAMLLSACSAGVKGQEAGNTIQETTTEASAEAESSEVVSEEETEKDLQDELLKEYAEEKYKQECEDLNYKDLVRYESELKGKKINIMATVTGISDGKFNCQTADKDEYCINDVREYDTTKVLLDDIVSVWGECAGVAAITNPIDDTRIEIPQIDARYIAFLGSESVVSDSTEAATQAAQQDISYETMYVVNCNESITLRTSPSTKAGEIRQIPLGEAVSYIESAANGFYKVSYMGKTGYALASYLSKDKPYYGNAKADSYYEEIYLTMRVVNCNESITLRKSPSTTAGEIRQIPLGAVVSYIESSTNGFYKISYLGKTGYALASYLEFE